MKLYAIIIAIAVAVVCIAALDVMRMSEEIQNNYNETRELEQLGLRYGNDPFK